MAFFVCLFVSSKWNQICSCFSLFWTCVHKTPLGYEGLNHKWWRKMLPYNGSWSPRTVLQSIVHNMVLLLFSSYWLSQGVYCASTKSSLKYRIPPRLEPWCIKPSLCKLYPTQLLYQLEVMPFCKVLWRLLVLTIHGILNLCSSFSAKEFPLPSLTIKGCMSLSHQCSYC